MLRIKDFLPLYMLDDIAISKLMKSTRNFEIMIVIKYIWEYSTCLSFKLLEYFSYELFFCAVFEIFKIL
jgi:hypothetical protein